MEVISYIPAILGLLITGSFILVNNPRDIKNRVFALLNLVTAVWLLFLFFADTANNNSAALWFFRLGLFFGSFVFLLAYYFTLVFPFGSKFNAKRQFLISLPIVLVAFLSFTPLVVETVVVQANGAQPDKIGPLYAFTDVFLILYMLAGLVRFATKYKKADIKQKAQIRFVSYGIVIALVINIFTGIVLSLTGSSSKYISLGGISLFLFSLFVTYSMVKHRLFDVRLIVARSIAYILLLALLAGLYGLVVFGITERIAGDGVFGRQVVPVLAALMLVFTSPYLRRWLDRITNRIFYQDAYDPQVFLDELNKELVSTINTEQLLNDCSEIISKNIKADYCLFGLKETEYFKQRVLGNAEKVFSKSDISEVRATTPNLHEVVLVTEELDDEHADLRKKLRKYDIAILARLSTDVTSDQEGLGYMLLGQKKSGNPYNKQDIQLLEIIANELVIAVQNALRFEEIENFNATLQQKVDDATHKLQRANEKLKALDETKDEFISMASHQLRTPLTSVKGYVSMVLEGDAGELEPMQRKLLEQSFASSQRMVYLIADLLNLSRLRTGKFVVEPKPTNLADVIETEVEQLKASAAGRNLTLTYEKPAKFPSLMLDETKIRQVIMNFSDNAIYYTPAGGKINIQLKESKDSVEFTVNDNGIGIPAAEQHKLFAKFYRAKNAQKARPDGTGLGLFMAKKVIIAQGGAIVFKSVHDKGSTFGFTFSKAKLKVPDHLGQTNSDK